MCSSNIRWKNFEIPLQLYNQHVSKRNTIIITTHQMCLWGMDSMHSFVFPSLVILSIFSSGLNVFTNLTWGWSGVLLTQHSRKYSRCSFSFSLRHTLSKFLNAWRFYLDLSRRSKQYGSTLTFSTPEYFFMMRFRLVRWVCNSSRTSYLPLICYDWSV